MKEAISSIHKQSKKSSLVHSSDEKPPIPRSRLKSSNEDSEFFYSISMSSRTLRPQSEDLAGIYPRTRSREGSTLYVWEDADPPAGGQHDMRWGILARDPDPPVVGQALF